MTEVKRSVKITQMQVRVLAGLLGDKARATRGDESAYAEQKRKLRMEYDAFNKERWNKWPAYYVKNVKRALATFLEARDVSGCEYNGSNFVTWSCDLLKKEFEANNQTPERFTTSEKRCSFVPVPFHALGIEVHVHPDAVASFREVAASLDNAVLTGDLSGIQEKIAAL